MLAAAETPNFAMLIHHEPHFSIVIVRSGLLIARASSPDQDWRELQSQFGDFVSSLRPAPLEDMLDALFAEWPSLAWREAEIRLWALGRDQVFDLEAGAIA
jgi:hypothetical protein